MKGRHQVHRIRTTAPELERYLDKLTVKAWEVASVSVEAPNEFLVVLRRRSAALSSKDGTGGAA